MEFISVDTLIWIHLSVDFAGTWLTNSDANFEEQRADTKPQSTLDDH
jgi:hypothetical protein